MLSASDTANASNVAAILPTEVWFNILSQCTPFEILNFMKVNQSCYLIGEGADAWRHLATRCNIKKPTNADNYAQVHF